MEQQVQPSDYYEFHPNMEEVLQKYAEYDYIIQADITFTEFNRYCKKDLLHSFGHKVKKIDSNGILFKININEIDETLLIAISVGNLNNIKKYTIDERVDIIKKSINQETFGLLKDDIYKTCENIEAIATNGKYYNARLFRFDKEGNILHNFAISFNHNNDFTVPYESIIINTEETKGFRVLLQKSTEKCFKDKHIYDDIVNTTAATISFFLEYQKD